MIAGWPSGLARFRRPGGRLLWQFVSRGRLVVNPDRLKPSLGDAQGVRSIPVATPHRRRTAGSDFLDEALGEELGDDLAGRAAGQIRRPFKRTVVTSRGGCQQPQLGVGQFHGILHRLRRRLAPPPPKPRNGHEAGGAGFRIAIRARDGDSTAPFAPESQSLLDHFVAGFRPNGSWSVPAASPTSTSPMQVVPRRLEFDTSRFESSEPSQPTLSLPGDCLSFAKRGHFRRLVATALVSGEESRPSCAESLRSRGKSLRTDFSISGKFVQE
jgi:hypothetical protein